ncbi:hypothetical protein ACQP25_45320 (plasmid) [Microtetraspora malaysiensis]
MNAVTIRVPLPRRFGWWTRVAVVVVVIVVAVVKTGGQIALTLGPAV